MNVFIACPPFGRIIKPSKNFVDSPKNATALSLVAESETLMPKAKNLTYLRKKAGLTQQALSDATGFAKSTINAWETKKRSIPKNRSLELCAFFDVPYHDFCDEDLENLNKQYDKPLKLSAIERQNIALFRELPDDIKHAIRQMIIHSHKLMKGEKG